MEHLNGGICGASLRFYFMGDEVLGSGPFVESGADAFCVSYLNSSGTNGLSVFVHVSIGFKLRLTSESSGLYFEPIGQCFFLLLSDSVQIPKWLTGPSAVGLGAVVGWDF